MSYVSIITPTYNRDELLKSCYESLLKQTDKRFEWIVIDDGSIDETENVISGFIKANKIKLRYYKKENGGKHTAINYAFTLLSGDICLILDSDDILTEDAVSSIIKCWENVEDKTIGSITFLRRKPCGQIIGDKFPLDYYLSDYISCRINENITGDKAETFKVSELIKYRFPEFKDEKFLGESVLWIRFAQNCKSLFVNKAIYITSYLEGGLTQSGRKMRLNNPLGGMEYANSYLNCNRIKISIRLQKALLFIIYAISAKKKGIKHTKINKRFQFMYLFYPIAYLIYKKWSK